MREESRCKLLKAGLVIALLFAVGRGTSYGKQGDAEAGPRVRVDSGVLEGLRSGSTGGEFLGIPYAAPPVGDLRWRPPQQPAPWVGVRQANAYGPACPQRPSPWLPELLGRTRMITDEACLFLNVWTPHLSRRANLPVMVWIHGGGNVEGSQEWPPLGPAVARRGVVVVTINYRLGVLGYLSLPALTLESPHHASGNYGLLDQAASLEWVRRNIAQFGGDPGKVTVFGASSGSLDICDLMASRIAPGLFRGAIMQSGVCVDSAAPRIAQAEAEGARFAQKLGATGDTPGLKRLRSLPADDLVRAAAADAEIDLNPVVDGWVLKDQPGVIFAHGRQMKIPVIVGSNTDEVSIFASPMVGGSSKGPRTVSEYRARLAQVFHDNSEAVFAAYPAQTDAEVAAAFRAMDTDYSFGFGAQLLAREVAASGERAYLYTFTHAGQGRFAALGAFHSEESMFLSKHYWTTWHREPRDERLSDAILGYWTGFAKDLKPSAPGLPPWPPYGAGQGIAQELGDHIGPVSDGRGAQMQVFGRTLTPELRR
jgi:para-nitrobenzyl esterase